MSEADDIARRFIALWSDYLAALAADPKTAEPLQRWLGLAAAAMPGSPAPDARPFDARPSGPSRSPADPAASAGASGERDAAVAELARRLDELETRIAALEPRRKSAKSPRPRNRTPRQTRGGAAAGMAGANRKVSIPRDFFWTNEFPTWGAKPIPAPTPCSRKRWSFSSSLSTVTDCGDSAGN